MPSTGGCRRLGCGRNRAEPRDIHERPPRSRTTTRAPRRSRRCANRRASSSGGGWTVTVRVRRSRRFASRTWRRSSPWRRRGARTRWISSRFTKTLRGLGASRCAAAAGRCSSGRGRACWARRARGSQTCSRFTRPSGGGAPRRSTAADRLDSPRRRRRGIRLPGRYWKRSTRPCGTATARRPCRSCWRQPRELGTKTRSGRSRRRRWRGGADAILTTRTGGRETTRY